MAIRRRTDDHQQALPLVFRVFQANIHVNAIRPEVDILLARKVAAIPLRVLRCPLIFQANDDIGTEPLGLFAQQRLQSLGEVSG